MIMLVPIRTCIDVFGSGTLRCINYRMLLVHQRKVQGSSWHEIERIEQTSGAGSVGDIRHVRDSLRVPPPHGTVQVDT
uniref:Uncharacterized protein n=1 Tax=Ciona intestinalis TaxID=7719 RepID=H2Y035_CIOIN